MDEKAKRAVPTTPELKRVLRFIEELRMRNVLVSSMKFDGVEIELTDLQLVQGNESSAADDGEDPKHLPEDWREAINQYRKGLNE